MLGIIAYRNFDILGLKINTRLLNKGIFRKVKTSSSTIKDNKLKNNNFHCIVEIAVDDFILNNGYKTLFDEKRYLYGYKQNKFCILLKNKKAIAWFDNSLKKLEIIIHPNNQWRLYAKMLTRLFLPFLLSRNSGFMLHACGIKYKGRGLVFVGPSGSGKTTIANLCRRGDVIDDDIIVVRKEGRNFLMSNLPWDGSKTRIYTKQSLINDIFIIKHAKKNSLEKVNISERFKKIFRQSCYCFLTINDKINHISLLYNFVNNADCYKFSFLPRYSIWDKIDKAVFVTERSISDET